MAKSMDLSGAEFFIAALAAFYLGRSCNVLVLSFRGTTGCRGQNHPQLCLKAIWTFIIRPRQCLSSVRVLDPNVKWARATNSLAPHTHTHIYIYIYILWHNILLSFFLFFVFCSVYCVRYIILLYCLYYFNVLYAKIEHLMLGVL